MDKLWLQWAKELQFIAQAGLAYSKDPYDKERFEQIRNISVDIIKNYTELEEDKVRTLFAEEKGYQTPKVDIRGAVFNEVDEILLVKETVDNCWSLPGGWADIDLSVSENVIKEAKEEAGAVVEPVKLVSILDRQKHIDDLFPYSVYKIFVECRLVSLAFEENIETTEHGFFPLAGLPELSVGRNTYKQIELCFKAHLEKNFEPVVD